METKHEQVFGPNAIHSRDTKELVDVAVKPLSYLKSHGCKVKFLVTGEKKKKEITFSFLRKRERKTQGTTGW